MLRTLFSPLFVLAVLGPVLYVSCTDQIVAAQGGIVEVGTLPDDVCLINGVPQVVSVSVENEGDIDLSYFTREKFVSLKYGTGIGSLTTKPQGRLEWPLRKSLNCDE